MKKLIFFWFPPIFWAVAIFVFSSQPRVVLTGEKVTEFLIFKSLHILEYGALYFFTFQAIKNTFNLSSQKVFLYTFIIVILYALSDEIHQTFVPTREGKLRDVFIDGIGAFLSGFILKKREESHYS